MNKPFAVTTLDPVEVHRGSPMYGDHQPTWEKRARRDDDPHDRSGYRCCSYCGSMHPEDLITALRDGARLQGTNKSYKRYVILPNPIAGQDVKMGSASGPTHERRVIGEEPKLRTDMVFTPEELAAGRYDREIRGAAPTTIHQKFYMEHTTHEQWELVLAAIGIIA